jgi:hypothetical protein
MSAMLDTVQEYRAEQAAESLKVSVALKERVLRVGKRLRCPVRNWFPAMLCYSLPGIWSPRMGASSKPEIFLLTRHC